MTATLADVFALAGTSAAELATGRTRLGTILRTQGIDETNDLARVRSLPRRTEMSEHEIAALSAYLRRYPATPVCPRCSGTGGPEEDPCVLCSGSGRIMLHAAQAIALRELYDLRGLFAPMRCGSGKTLVTLLAATLLASERPVLMLPASCRDKTRRDFAVYSEAWNVRLPRLLAYEELSHPDHERDLLDLRPDLILLDEAHKVRNLSAACSKRVRRAIEYVQPRPVIGCLSGTLITDELMDSHHHAVWSLGAYAPVPLVAAEAQRWATAVDKDTPITARSELGALETLPGGFHGWFLESRGVVPTPGSECSAAIEISRWRPVLPEKLRETIAVTQASGMRPDGELLDPLRIPDCLCTLALGFYLTWRDPPPLWWLQPRRAYFGWERDLLGEHVEACSACGQCWRHDDPRSCRCPRGPTLACFDSPDTVRQGLDRFTHRKAGPYPPSAREGAALLAAWREVKDRFEPIPVPVWLDDAPIRELAARMRPATVAWFAHPDAGVRLAEYGIPFYGADTDPESAKRGTPIGCSIESHGTGKNLQRGWHRMIVTHGIPNAETWEQLIARHHRQGQREDLVEVEIIEAIAYHRSALERARASARRTSENNRFPHKLVDATWVD